MTPESPLSAPAPQRKRYVRAVGPRLRLVLYLIFGLFAVLGANSVYLASVSLLGWIRDASYENYFYQYMFLAHLILGLGLILPVVVFGIVHLLNARDRPNRRAVRVGYVLFAVSLVLLVTGVALMRVGNLKLTHPTLRSVTYWAHVIAPLPAGAQ